MGKAYKDMTPEEKEAQKKRVIESRAKTQKRIPLDYKKEIAEKIYSHAEESGTAPITWIKKAIAKMYLEETGCALDESQSPNDKKAAQAE